MNEQKTDLCEYASQLSNDEIDAIQEWIDGKTMIEAYCDVMGKKEDINSLTKQTLNKKVQRFFGKDKIKKIMDANKDLREKSLAKLRAMAVYTPVVKHVEQKIKKVVAAEEKERRGVETKEGKDVTSTFIDEVVAPNVIANRNEIQKQKITQDLSISKKSAREKWLKSLSITDEPEAISVYGTGQFIMYHAVNEMMKRDQAIKEKKRETGIFDKNGSVFTPLILKAFNVATSMIVPFTQTNNSDKDGIKSMAAAILDLSLDNLNTDPDAYTAPVPPTAEVIDVETDNENKED